MLLSIEFHYLKNDKKWTLKAIAVAMSRLHFRCIFSNFIDHIAPWQNSFFSPKKSSLEVNMFFEDYPFLSRTRTQKENESVYNWIEVQIHSLSKKSESLHLKNWIEANLINEKGKAFIYHSHRSAF